ncbi:polyhydroxyalkanoic acid synthase subunit PhaR [Metabacillus bambusae]|uniref:Polyhydroxyalkanoic acid synthase subunit PhaR n=1 Tax=Metabacillus bambusae TaxID=2795218 RepID=A0ABS3N3F8_9BACI|nr:polyhydroxyalkanoic acid synthase subunit PhaR [Metabacillus bambusae]MBO1512604.1 polyhydroxyalkanoic acid synthase subunit PhaR [Metabacillus bambusae]
MTQQKNFNPMELWKDIYNQSESYWSSVLDEKMKEEYFSEWMGKVLEMNLQFKKMLNETTEGYLSQVNLPTQNDLANIASLVVNVDSKVDSLEELVEENSSNQVNQAELKREMTRVKNEIKSLNNKLDNILALLNEKSSAGNVNETAKTVENQ